MQSFVIFRARTRYGLDASWLINNATVAHMSRGTTMQSAAMRRSGAREH